MKEATFIIVGGGIAGVSCAEGIDFLAPEESIIIVSSSPMAKKVTNVRHLTKMLSEFNVEEQTTERIMEDHPNIPVLHDTVLSLDCENQVVELVSGETVGFERLCVCSGGYPKWIGDSPFIVGIRDTDSAEVSKAAGEKQKSRDCWKWRDSN